MKANWEVKKLGEVIELVYGKPLPDSKRKPDGLYPAYGANGEKDRTDEYYYNKKSIIVGRKGSAGEINLTEEKFWPLDVTYFVTFDEKKYDLTFIYHMLTRLELPKLATGVKPGINRNEVYSIKAQFPPLAEQQRIVAILDEAFAAIDRAKAKAETNRQNARALFESYLQSVFANPGEGWEEKSLNEVCTIDSKLIDPRHTKYLDMLHVGGANIESLTGRLMELKTAREEELISGKFLFDKTVVLYSKIRPYLIKVARPEFEGLCSADIYPLAPIKNKMIRDYLFYLLLSPEFTQYAIDGSARSGMPKVNREHLFEFKFYVGSVWEQQAIVAKLDQLSAETKKLEAIYRQKIADLDELKKAILQKAFRGELTKTQGELTSL